jgi:RNA polymerase sigma-70 factor (ECF subfamily)
MQQTCSVQMPDSSKETEIELVASAQRDPAAFRSLYEQYARPVYRYLYTKVGNQADAQDLTSQVFLKALEDLGNFRNQGGFRAWLFSIAYSQAMDYYRKARAELPLDEIDLAAHEPDPLATTIHQQQIERMRKRIAALPEEEQELIRLRFVAGLRYAEIGEVLKRREGAVKKALYRLLARLGEQMEDDHGG